MNEHRCVSKRQREQTGKQRKTMAATPSSPTTCHTAVEMELDYLLVLSRRAEVLGDSVRHAVPVGAKVGGDLSELELRSL